MACRFLPRLLVLFLVLALGLHTEIRAADPSDKFVSEEEFAALFEPDPAETIKKRGLAKVPRPGFDSKTRAATSQFLFEIGSITLKSADSFQQLDAAGRAFKKALEVGKDLTWIIEIGGYTDNVGNPENNRKLSKERAESVRQYLLQTYGLPQTMIIAQGYGEANPIASNDSSDGREKNRRTVFRIIARTAFEQGLAEFQSGNYSLALDAWQGKAERGHADAQFYLGVLYANGKGTPQDYGLAGNWYRKAAEQGHTFAQYSLGQMYFEGLGVPQDFVSAYMWTNLSSAQGFFKASDLRDTVSLKMTPEQIAEAQKFSREWKPKK